MSKRKDRSKSCRSASRVIETLEPRRLLSTGSALAGWYQFSDNGFQDVDNHGIILDDDLPTRVYDPDLHGTAGDDLIAVTTHDAMTALVVINGVKTYVAAPSEIRIDARRGSDLIDLSSLTISERFTIIIRGGAGDDTITGSSAAEKIFAGDGNDVASGNDGRDTIYGEAGDDSIRGGGSSDLLDGGDGADTLRGDAGNDNIAGGANPDRLRGSDGNDRLDGGGGRDLLAGEKGDDAIFGGAGDDNVSGGDGLDTFDGGSGNDTIEDDLDQQRAAGTNLEFSSVGAASASETRGVGASDTDTWGGQTVTGSDTLVMYTYGGDANLSGQVDVDDYGQIDFNASTGGVLTGWYNGDFNYDGVVDIDDYTIIDFANASRRSP